MKVETSSHVALRPKTKAPKAAKAPRRRSVGAAKPKPVHVPTTFAARESPRSGPSLDGALARAASTRTATQAALVGDAPALTLEHGATEVVDRKTFEKLARRDDVPGALGAREVKFLMVDVDTDHPQLYFINSNNHAYHWDFATNGLGKEISLEEFNSQTYFKDKRKNLAGSIIAHDQFQSGSKKGLYAMEFWPTDPVRAKHVAMAFKAIEKAMPFAKGQLQYHPAGDTQEALFAKDKAALQQAGVKSIDTETLFKNVKYSPLNAGESFGILTVFDGTQQGARPPTARDIAIFKTLPNDLTHVAGVISETPQTPLSHINLKAKQNNTPNAYIANLTKDPRIAALIGKPVRFKVTPDGYEIEPATQAQVDKYLENVRPKKVQKAGRDLTVTKITDLDQISTKDTDAFGAKSANIGEMRNFLPRDKVPDGYAIPFKFYDDFMKANGLYDAAKKMMADPKFKSDPAVRERMLEEFQRKLKRADVPPEMEKQLSAVQAKFPAGQPIRARSSTNNEDLEGFNGAGLYDSYTHRPDEGKLSKTVKQVWASLWNYRAFEEREFWKIDHLTAAMGVTLHPNSDDENANGVAVTKNIYDPNWPGFYVNVQVGESLVTNPDPNATPDEMLISAIGEHGEWETQYIKHSTLAKNGKNVLTAAQTKELTAMMAEIQEHFRRVYGKQDDPKFAMDIEFKVGSDGKLFVKQARPWVE